MSWWIAVPQFLDNFRVSEPAWNVSAFVQTPAKIGARKIEHAGSVQDLVLGHVAVLVCEVDHHVERNHGDPNLGLVLLEQILGFIGTIKGFTVTVFAGTGVVSPHDEVRAAMILTDECVPNGFPRPAHPHRQR